MLDRIFGASPNSPLNPVQQETACDGDIAREAQHLCKVFNNPRRYNSPSDDAMRAAYGGREADYLYARFAGVLGWQTLADAAKFYRRNR